MTKLSLSVSDFKPIQSAHLITDEVKKVYGEAQSLSDKIYGFSKKIDEAAQAEGADEDLIEVAALVVDMRVLFHELQKKVGFIYLLLPKIYLMPCNQIYSLGSGVGSGILHNNTTNGLWLNYLASLLVGTIHRSNNLGLSMIQ